ncbi:exodeoxyribonuclease III [Taibaiella sp. KBW10]|uniref:exodeoxyribonuclease III n=1 Tax=Taibaiella sp. KBW10 TaxID=2153357 RepID=UPI000F59DE57|nr:exodeoxyribonuclease III [Taibaiella sp. KBW10]RQO30191.1 exodeoxyribonuclease III [Taibaiella sp. KBW10]
MKIISYNVNGLRSAMNKGLVTWLQEENPDVICFQEIKAHKENVDFKQFEDLGYETFWYPAQKKGYSGVAIFSKRKPDAVTYGSGFEQSDFEGRALTLTFGNTKVISAYFPSGTSGDERQTYKYQWLAEFFDYIEALKKVGHSVIVCGDYNICHKPIDIHNPVSNKNSSGFLPEERAWMDKWFDNGLIDTFRIYNQDPHHYSWWSYRANARANNKGWRIDYISVTADLQSKVKSATILPEANHSDHCPVVAEIEL